MAKPLQLTETQEVAIARAAYALNPADQATFHTRVIEQLASCAEPGDGDVYRAYRLIQRTLFDPPQEADYYHAARPLNRFR